MKECGKNCILSKVKDKSHTAKIMSQTANNIVESDIISSADTNKNNFCSHCCYVPEPSNIMSV